MHRDWQVGPNLFLHTICKRQGRAAVLFTMKILVKQHRCSHSVQLLSENPYSLIVLFQPELCFSWRSPGVHLSFVHTLHKDTLPLLFYIPDSTPSHPTSPNPQYPIPCNFPHFSVMGPDGPRWFQFWKYTTSTSVLVLKTLHISCHNSLTSENALLLRKVLLQMNSAEEGPNPASSSRPNQTSLDIHKKSCKKHFKSVLFLKWTKIKQLYTSITEYCSKFLKIQKSALSKITPSNFFLTLSEINTSRISKTFI